MNKKIIILLGLVLMITTILGLGSCAKDGNDTPDTTVTEPEGDTATPTAVRTEVDSYVLIFPEGMHSFASDTASNVSSYIKRKANVTLAKEEDYETAPTANRYEIIVGNTEREETKAALTKLDYNQYGVFVSDYKIVIVGWTEYTTRLAVVQFNKLMSDHIINENGKYYFSFPDKTEFVETSEEYLGGIPAFDGTIGGVYDCADGAYSIYYTDVADTAFATYETTVKGDGYTLYTENTLGSNQYATYTKDDKLLHFYYIASAKELRVVYGANDTNPAFVQTNTAAGNVTPAVTMMPMNYTAAAGGGACIIYTLTDGTFLVIDGGWADEASLLYTTLKALNEDANGPDAPIVISAWFLTHAHGDHTGCIKQFASNYGDKVSVNAILCNAVHEAQMSDSKIVPYLDADNLKSVLESFKTTSGETPSVMKLHTGQKLTFGGMTADVLFTHEDLFGTKITNFNDFNTVLRVTLGGNSFFLTADATKTELIHLIDELPSSVLKSDFCQMGHHGADSGYAKIYEVVDAKYYLWNNSKEHYIRDTEQNQYAWCLYVLEHAEEIYIADTYCYTLELPYAAKSAIEWRPGLERPSDKKEEGGDDTPITGDGQYDATATPSYGDTIGWDEAKAYDKVTQPSYGETTDWNN